VRPRNFARPAAAGALCFAITCANAETAAAQSTTEPTAIAAQQPRIKVNHRAINVRSGKRATVFGRVAPAAPGMKVTLQVKRGRSWRGIEGDRTDARGRYRLRQRLHGTLSRKVRVRVRRAPGFLPARRRVGRLNVYRHAHASWYGPGLYGNRTGCGGTLSPGRLGVAHKTLPCGTKVTFKHRGRRVRVPVIDRGPYVGGREYDLTEATAQRLRFRGHGAILTTR
jgi:rare lipoprotein A (peptidoglycan hydrolase)